MERPGKDKKWHAGEVRGDLTLIRIVPNKKYETSRRWLCRCICGNDVVYTENNLRYRTSCGCSKQSAPGGTHVALCWSCQNATDYRKCPWVKDFSPVDGWTAVDTGNGYFVKACPIYKRDEPRRTV